MMIPLAASTTASTDPLLPSWPEFIIGTILFVLVFGAFAKLLLRDRAAAIVFAFDHGLVAPTPRRRP